jgi:hypothetical protein
MHHGEDVLNTLALDTRGESRAPPYEHRRLVAPALTVEGAGHSLTQMARFVAGSAMYVRYRVPTLG